MTYHQFAGLGIFLVGFLNLYALVARFDRWRARLGPAGSAPAARVALLIYVAWFVVFPMAFGLALIYILRW